MRSNLLSPYNYHHGTLTSQSCEHRNKNKSNSGEMGGGGMRTGAVGREGAGVSSAPAPTVRPLSIACFVLLSAFVVLGVTGDELTTTEIPDSSNATDALETGDDLVSGMTAVFEAMRLTGLEVSRNSTKKEVSVSALDHVGICADRPRKPADVRDARAHDQQDGAVLCHLHDAEKYCVRSPSRPTSQVRQLRLQAQAQSLPQEQEVAVAVTPSNYCSISSGLH
ncbi:hypothetical protein J6590_020915 [Homalodisca vitripennis]|nr:hypothetical protein J6590_020915 [Homalodisca vitripennis]